MTTSVCMYVFTHSDTLYKYANKWYNELQQHNGRAAPGLTRVGLVMFFSWSLFQIVPGSEIFLKFVYSFFHLTWYIAKNMFIARTVGSKDFWEFMFQNETLCQVRLSVRLQ